MIPLVRLHAIQRLLFPEVINKDSFQVGTKRKRVEDSDDVTKGAERARQFLKDFSELPLDKMELEQALEQVRKLKDGLEKDAVNSCWLQKFF